MWLIDPYTEESTIDFPPEMKKIFLEECKETVVKINQQFHELWAIEEQNFDKGYLSQFEGQKELNMLNGDSYDYDLWETTDVSSYFNTIVTGPLWVNVANVLMIIPFTVSAVIASFNAFRKNEETNKASRISVFAMGIGFISMIVGFISILLAIGVVYKPYI